MKIVVRCESGIDRKRDLEGKLYLGEDFHKVDLKENKIVHKYYRSMWNSLCKGGMLLVHPRLYVLAGMRPEEDPPALELDGDGRHCYAGCSFLDLNDGDGKLLCWKYGPQLPNDNNFILDQNATLYGDIYSFGNRLLSPMVLKQGARSWKELPKNWPHEISECQVSSPVVSDPANSRILVHLYPSYLCAFYPFECNAEGIQEGRWDIMCTHFIGRRWGNAVTLAAADGMLYTHDSYTSGHGRSGTFLHAYHIATDRFFDVSWSSSKVINSNGHYAHLRNFAFDSLLYDYAAGDLWFAAWSPGYNPKRCYVVFFNFKAEVNVKAQQVVCTPVRLLSFDLDPDSRVTDFIQIHHDEEDDTQWLCVNPTTPSCDNSHPSN